MSNAVTGSRGFAETRVVSAFVALTCLFVLAVSGSASATPNPAIACSSIDKSVMLDDGSIAIAAKTFGSGCPESVHPSRILVIKLDADGSINERFGDNGAYIPGPQHGSNAVNLLPAGDGLLLITSQGLIRLDRNGAPDPSFGSNGEVSNFPPALAASLPITTANIQEDGRIVVAAGYSEFGDPDLDPAVARFEPDGDPDLTFGGDGVVNPDLSGGNANFRFEGIGIDGQGRIIVGIMSGRAMRLLPNGTIDLSYGPGETGFVGLLNTDATYAGTMYVDEDGTARLYGYQYFGFGSSNYVWTLDPDGDQDPDGPRGLGNGASAVFAETSDGGLASTEYLTYPVPPGEIPAFNVNKVDSDFEELFDVGYEPWASTGPVQTISYSPVDNSLLAGTSARNYSSGIPPNPSIGLVKLDADTGALIESFGTDGAVVLEGGTCPHGVGPTSDKDTPYKWYRCLVEPPGIKGKVKFLFGGSRRPSFRGSIVMPAPSAKAGETLRLRQNLTIRMPSRLRLVGRKPIKVQASTSGSHSGATEVKTNGRTIRVIFTQDPQDIDQSASAPPLKVRFRIPRGKLKAIPRKLRRKNLKVNIQAISEPLAYKDPVRPSEWDASNRAAKTLKARPVKRQRR